MHLAAPEIMNRVAPAGIDRLRVPCYCLAACLLYTLFPTELVCFCPAASAGWPCMC